MSLLTLAFLLHWLGSESCSFAPPVTSAGLFGFWMLGFHLWFRRSSCLSIHFSESALLIGCFAWRTGGFVLRLLGFLKCYSSRLGRTFCWCRTQSSQRVGWSANSAVIVSSRNWPHSVCYSYRWSISDQASSLLYSRLPTSSSWSSFSIDFHIWSLGKFVFQPLNSV